MEKKLLTEMFDSLLHIGNKTNYWNPNMKPYIYGSVNGIHVINLVKTAQKLDEVKEQLKQCAAEGKKILFVATKLQGRDAFAKLAQETGHYYVTEKWVWGLLTNFKTVKKRIATYVKLLRDVETGALNVLTKKERAAQMAVLEKLDKAFKWVKEMKKVPDVLFVVDGAYEASCIKEWNTLGLQVFAVLNTNGDDMKVLNAIPANTNSVKSLDFLASRLKDAIGGVKVAKKAPVKRIVDKKDTSNAAKPVKKAAPKKAEEKKTEEK